MKKIVSASSLLLVVGFSAWLFLNDKAAEPGALSRSHADAHDCETCHVPWKGVSAEMCLQCHEFSDVTNLPPELRFHETEQYCLRCHQEHRGATAKISQMDHTLLNGDLLCSQCHLDRHNGLFGQECRECHRITTWKVQGFRHPPEEKKNCSRCHKAPRSHYDEHFWGLIEKDHFQGQAETKPIEVKECWLCHNTRPHSWRHRRIRLVCDPRSSCFWILPRASLMVARHTHAQHSLRIGPPSPLRRRFVEVDNIGFSYVVRQLDMIYGRDFFYKISHAFEILFYGL